MAIVALLTAGCEAMLAKEARQDIAAVRRAVAADPRAVDAPLASGELPLVVAMRVGSGRLFSWLVQRGASATALDATGSSALHAAVIYDPPDHRWLRALLDRGAPVDIQAWSNGCDSGTPLHLAAWLVKPATVEFLLGAGADPNRADARGETPLHRAATYPVDDTPADRVIATIDGLVAAGARVDAATTSGARPLHAAALLGRRAAVGELLRCGAPVDATDRAGRTALFEAALFGRTDVVSDLLAAGADPSHRDGSGLTPLAVVERYPAPTVDTRRAVELLAAAGGGSSARQPGPTPSSRQ